MAVYDNLPVFKLSYDLLLYVLKFASNIQRDLRYTVGETLQRELLGLCLDIYRANAASQRLSHVEQAREHLVTIRLMLRILHDTRQISIKQFALTCEKVESISKQLAAWHKYLRSRNHPDALVSDAAPEEV